MSDSITWSGLASIMEDSLRMTLTPMLIKSGVKIGSDQLAESVAPKLIEMLRRGYHPERGCDHEWAYAEQGSQCTKCRATLNAGPMGIGAAPSAGKSLATPSVPALLRGAAQTYEERNKAYGGGYKHFGKVMAGLFPNGLHIDASDVAALSRLGLIIMCASKLSRFCQGSAGHQDSAHDLMVYGGMLEELTLSDQANKR